MEKIIQDIYERICVFGPLIGVTALVIIGTGLLFYKRLGWEPEKMDGEYLFIEGLGWVIKRGEEITHVGELHRELRRAEVCERLPDQPENDEIGCDEAAASEDQG